MGVRGDAMKSFAIFLSSTFLDLQQHRKAVAVALERLGLHVIWMERFGARPDEPVTACLGEVGECDLFVGLYAHRYGFVPDGHAVSITEMEFEHARLQNKPVFCFFVQDDYPWPPPLIEGEPGRGKLTAFRVRASNEVVRDVFTTPDDLAAKATSAIGAYLKDRAYPPDGDRVTVERVTDVAKPSVLAALNLFTRRIPEAERFQPEDIIRWLQEDQKQQQLTGQGLRNYFMIARTRVRVCGFLLMHYYHRHRLAFIAYLVSEKEIAFARGTIAARLLDHMAQLLSTDEQLRACRGFLLEVDEPRHTADETARRRQMARVEFFCTLAQSRGYSLRALGIDYRQPLLHLPEEGDRGREVPMMLMYASRTVESFLPRADVEQLLGFVYQELYPQGFSAVEHENDLYRAYLNEFLAEQVARLPDRVQLLSSRDIRKVSKPQTTS
jgi:uncharacterized protein DUF4062